MKTLSNIGLTLIKSFEGCHLTAYDDLQPKVKLTPKTPIKGTLTIGWGHTGNVKVGQTITQKQADELLLKDLQRYISYVNNIAYVPFTNRLNQNQFDALVSFCYNCGPNNLKRLCFNSTISDIPINIIKYNKSKGFVLMGLVRRRNAELQLFLKDYKEDGNNMDNKKLQKLEEKILNLENKIIVLSSKLEEVPAPKWLVKEFPYILDVIKDKKGSYEFWRGIAISLRLSK